MNDDKNMFEVISNNPYVVVPAVCHLWHKLTGGCILVGINGNAIKLAPRP